MNKLHTDRRKLTIYLTEVDFCNILTDHHAFTVWSENLNWLFHADCWCEDVDYLSEVSPKNRPICAGAPFSKLSKNHDL